MASAPVAANSSLLSSRNLSARLASTSGRAYVVTRQRQVAVCAAFKLSDVTSNSRTAMVAIDATAPSTSAIASQERSGPSIPIVALVVGAVGLAAIAFKKFRQNG